MTLAHSEGSNVDGPDIAPPNFPPLPLPPTDLRTSVPTTFQVTVIRNTNQPATTPPSPPSNPSPQKRESASAASQDTFKEAITGTNLNSTGKNLSTKTSDGKATLSATTPPVQEQVKALSSPTAVVPSSTSQDTFREVITANSHRSGSSNEVEVSTGSVKTPATGTNANGGDGGGDGGVATIPKQNGQSGAVSTNGSESSAASRVAASVLPIVVLAACMYVAF
ncbi:hypothetical protein V7S43_013588 [Phytophthora oleae]|uniref:Uncharacterized protein n=1 Tax=Phytophthora oleae TaxID=2107226 RepID=A0ABD3F5T9_9STRA